MRRILFIILCLIFIGCNQNNKYGTIIEAAGIYQRDGSPIMTKNETTQTVIIKGTRVKMIDPDGCPAKDSEKMVVIMVPNEAHDFIKGYMACVPERKIKWD